MIADRVDLHHQLDRYALQVLDRREEVAVGREERILADGHVAIRAAGHLLRAPAGDAGAAVGRHAEAYRLLSQGLPAEGRQADNRRLLDIGQGIVGDP